MTGVDGPRRSGCGRGAAPRAQAVQPTATNRTLSSAAIKTTHCMRLFIRTTSECSATWKSLLAFSPEPYAFKPNRPDISPFHSPCELPNVRAPLPSRRHLGCCSRPLTYSPLRLATSPCLSHPVIFSHDLHYSDGQVICCVGCVGYAGCLRPFSQCLRQPFSRSLLLLHCLFSRFCLFSRWLRMLRSCSFAYSPASSGRLFRTLLLIIPLAQPLTLHRLFILMVNLPMSQVPTPAMNPSTTRRPTIHLSCVVGALLIRGDGVFHLPA